MTTLRGRETELGGLRRALGEAAAGRGCVAFVEGEAGIGKTRLLQELVADARMRGLSVYEGRCDDLGASRPFGAIADALGVSEGSLDADIAALARLLLRDDEATADVPGLQHRVVEGLGALVERLAARAPLLLALEDLHWADPSTLVALRSIAKRTAQLPVALVATTRPHHVPTLHRVTDEILRSGGVRVMLGPLAPDEIALLVADLVGGEPSPGLLVRVGGASGNPLFVTEYVRALSSETNGEAVPVEFRLTVLRRLAQMDDDAADIVRLASVLGSTFSPADIAAVLGRAVVDLVAPLQRATEGGVITERGELLAFRHDLVRDAVYEHMPLAVRKQLHRDAGRALAVADADPLRVAHHLAAGADATDEEAAAWLRRAAGDAMRTSPGVAAQLLERAVTLSPHATPQMRAELVLALAWAGRLAEAEALARDVLDLRPDPSVAGPLRCGLVYALVWQGRPREALRHAVAEEELEEGDAALLAAESALASLLALDLRTAGTAAGPALEAAKRAGHDLATCIALSTQSWVATFTGRPHAALELANEAIALAERVGGEAHLAHPRAWAGMPLVMLDRLDEAEAMLQEGRRQAEAMGLVWSLPLYHAYLGIKCAVAGDWDRASAEFEVGLAIADDVGMHMGGVVATAAWATVIAVHRDDLETAADIADDAMRRLAAAEAPAFGLLGWARAMLAEAHGDVEEALALLKPAWEAFMRAGNVTEPWSGMALVRLLVATGDTERAATLVPFLEQQAAVVGTPFTRGQAMRAAGLVAADPDVLLAALDEYRLSPRRPELAAACEDAGVHLARAGRTDEGVTYLNEALSIYEDVGAIRDARRARAHLREHGQARRVRGPRARATTGWNSLTPTEREVVALVAQRFSNPEVAERMFISRHTVESHLKSVYRKLDVSSRLELANQASRRRSGAR